MVDERSRKSVAVYSLVEKCDRKASRSGDRLPF